MTIVEWWLNIDPAQHIGLLKHRSQRELVDQEVDFIKSQVQIDRKSRILDLACGNGRHSAVLTEQGYRCIGLDYTFGLMAIAREHTIAVQGNMLNLPIAQASMDLVISMWQSVGYFEDDRQNDAVFNEMARVLRPDGYLVLQVNNPLYLIYKAFSSDGEVVDVKIRSSVTEIVENGHSNKLTEFDPTTFEYRSTRSIFQNRIEQSITHLMRYYSYPEIHRILAENGIQIMSLFGSTNSEPYGVDSKEMLLIGRRE